MGRGVGHSTLVEGAPLCGVEPGTRQDGDRAGTLEVVQRRRGLAEPDPILAMERWRKRWTVSEWRAFLAAAEASDDLNPLRQFTHNGRPLGSPEFVSALEAQTRRTLAARKGGRPKQCSTDSHQSTLTFVA
jgi:hypothetical protein